MELDWVFIIIVIIMICKPDDGFFSKAIVEAFEEVSGA